MGVAVRTVRGGCPGFDRTQQLRQARESQVWYVCVRVCVGCCCSSVDTSEAGPRSKTCKGGPTGQTVLMFVRLNKSFEKFL